MKIPLYNSKGGRTYKKLIDLMMFGMQFFVNFETKFLFIFLKGIDNKIFDFTEIQNRPPKSFFLYATPLRKINKICVSKLAKKCIPNIIKSIKNTQNWSIWWSLVCNFLPILKQNFCLFSQGYWQQNIWFYMDSK